MDVFPGPYNQIAINFAAVKEFISEELKKHEETLDPTSPRDFIDCFLIKMEQVTRWHKNLKHKYLVFAQNTLCHQISGHLWTDPLKSACGMSITNSQALLLKKASVIVLTLFQEFASTPLKRVFQNFTLARSSPG